MEELKLELLKIEAASLVELKFSIEDGFEKTYRGYYKLFRINQQDWSDEDYVRLSEVVDVTNNENEKGVRPIFVSISNILNVKVITAAENNVSMMKEKNADDKSQNPEFIFPTFVINKRESLVNLLETLQSVHVVGCSLEGDVHRFGIVKWINLLVDNTIVALEIEKLVMEMGEEAKLWNELDRGIFAKSSLVKVIHDCRMAADFLYHQHGICVENVFDTMIADIYLETKKSKGAVPKRFSSLSECLKRHCTDLVTNREMLVLSDCENHPNLSSYWLAAEPSRQILKIAAIKVKYLVFLRESLLRNIMSDYTTAVELHINTLFKASTK